MGSIDDLRALVSDLKGTAYDEQIHILQTLGDRLISGFRIQAFGVAIEPLWVEAYYYDAVYFPDRNTHRSDKQRDRFGRLYFHDRGYGGVDICLSDSENFCLSFLLKAALANGHFLTQTQLPRALLATGRQKAEFERLDGILLPADARHMICHTTRVNLAKPCYRDAPLTSFALDVIPQYDFRFARKSLRTNVREYLLAYMAAHPGCTGQECRAECRRVFGWVPDLVRELTHGSLPLDKERFQGDRA